MKIKTKRRNFYELVENFCMDIESYRAERQECKLNTITNGIDTVIYDHTRICSKLIKNCIHKFGRKFNRTLENINYFLL